MAKVFTFTISHNEPVFERLWRAYYGKAGDCAVYDPVDCPELPAVLGTTETELQQLEFVYQKTAGAFAHGYDVVMCPDTDEFLIPAGGESLKDFCDRMMADCVRAYGYAVVHDWRREPRMDHDDPLANRGLCYHTGNYSKTILTRVPLQYGVGRHWLCTGDGKPYQVPWSDALDLLHLRSIDLFWDFDRYSERCKRWGLPARTLHDFVVAYDRGYEDPNWTWWDGDPLPMKAHWRQALQVL